MHTPTKKLKELAEKPEADTIVQSIQEIFELDEESIKKLNLYRCEYHMDIKHENKTDDKENR